MTEGAVALLVKEVRQSAEELSTFLEVEGGA